MTKIVLDSEPLEVHPQSLVDLGFSSCGEYLHGKENGDRTLVVLNVASIIHGPKKLTEMESPMAGVGGHANLVVGRRLFDSNPHSTISPQQSILSMGQGQAQVVSLEQNHHTGSVTLKGQLGDRTSVQSSLARIPASITLKNSFPTLAKARDQDHVRLVLNQAPQMSYAASSTPDVRLPLVFDRRKETISIERMTLPCRIEGVEKRGIEDIGDDAYADDGDGDVRKAKYPRNV